MKRILALIFSITLLNCSLTADEGMWLVNLLNMQTYDCMRSKGVVISANEIYSESEESLKDAIVAINGGECSGSMISPEGLMITNHHCAYGDIHSLSTPENNYLENGFWAMTRDKEVYIEGKTVTFLHKVIDVTQQVNVIIDSLDKTGPRGIRFLDKVEKALLKLYPNDKSEKSLNSFYKGCKYYLYFYETFEDVRLVGAPPVSIGAFGGEVDNWAWPQHKGDFALYRVYASKDGKPAKHSKNNVPLKPGKFLKISGKGINEGDFTMIIGYPGSTNRYISSGELTEKYEILNPVISSVRRAKLDVYKSYMDASKAIRLKYSDKYFSISNESDYYKWENTCIGKYDIISKRKDEEKELEAWINDSNERKAMYGNVVADIRRGYSLVSGITKTREFIRETMGRGSDALIYGQRFGSMGALAKRNKKDSVDYKDEEVAYFLENNFKTIFIDQDIATEKDVFIKMIQLLIDNVDEKYCHKGLTEMVKTFNNSVPEFADYIFKNSVLTDSVRLKNFVSAPKTIEDINSDPLVKVSDFLNVVDYNRIITSTLKNEKIDLASLKTKYVSAIYKMRLSKGEKLYPDANSTMRLTYGNIEPLIPSDAIYYHWQTSIKGILEKYTPDNYEFNLRPDYKALLESQKWEKGGNMYVDFLSNNDITAGNSGSATLNAKGELIGIVFDGNRESMSGKIYYNQDMNKSISVDIRYVLWIIKKYAKADNIINELIIN